MTNTTSKKSLDKQKQINYNKYRTKQKERGKEQMNNTVQTALDAIGMTTIGRYASRIRGRRNWSVRIEANRNVAFVGGYGLMKSRGMLREYLKTIAKYGITWIEFTYKKDFTAFVEALEKEGMTIIWVQ
jgi:hypothetical protein